MTDQRKRRAAALRWGLLLLALAMLAGGLALGEGDTVLVKAANICLECVGIG